MDRLRPTIVVKFRQFIRIPRMMLWAFFMESVETKQMIHTFVRQGRGRLLVRMKSKNPTEEEMQRAYAQLRDIPRFLPFFVFIAVPVPGVTEGYTLLAVTLESWLGQKVSLLPSHFRGIFQKQTPPAEEADGEKGQP